MTEEIMKEFNQKFKERYAKTEQLLNKNLTVVEEVDGTYSVPDITTEGDNVLDVKLVYINKPAITATTTVRFSVEDIKKIMDNPGVFTSFMDMVVDKALYQHIQKYGHYNVIRFGTSYAKFKDLIFDQTENKVILTVEGKFAEK